MSARSDYALELQLERILHEAKGEDVKTAISATLEHMHSGSSKNRRGGKKLVLLLSEVRLRAARGDEWSVVRLVQDSIDYAEGRIFKQDFEERYHLFQDGVRDDINRSYISGITYAGLKYAAKLGREFLDERPNATADDLLEKFSSLGEDARFLDAPEDRPGRYRILRGRAELAAWTEQVLRNRIDVENPEQVARKIVASPKALAVLAGDPEGQTLLRAAELQRRAADLAKLREKAEDPMASERDLQAALEGQHWIFGGRFVGEAARRRLVPGDEVDIPLIRGDGALHIVELKRSMSLRGALVKRYRNSWVPTAEVHDAVAQAMNYLLSLDENRQKIREEFGIEVRRASAVVLIGHPALQPEIPEEDINEVLRTFNAHVSRIEVLTYKELIDSAERSLGDPTV